MSRSLPLSLALSLYIYIYIQPLGLKGAPIQRKGGTMLRGHIAPKCTQMQLKEITSQQAAENILKPLAAPRCCPHISPQSLQTGDLKTSILLRTSCAKPHSVN